MPKKIEKRLRTAARRKGLKGEQANRYVYGGLTNIKKKMKRKRGK